MLAMVVFKSMLTAATGHLFEDMMATCVTAILSGVGAGCMLSTSSVNGYSSLEGNTATVFPVS